MSEQHSSQPPITRETTREMLDALAAQPGGIVPSADKLGNTYLFTDDATEANAHLAAESGVWEKWAQPGFEESAKSIALDAQKETAHESAHWEDHRREMAKEDEQSLEALYADEDAKRAAEDEEAQDAYEEQLADEREAAERREHEAYLRGDDDTEDIGGDLEARSGISNQDAIAATYHDGENDYPNHDEAYDDDEDTEDPLEGDVDKFVHPDETADPGLAWGNHARAAREHGDLTES
jgi:hypothetical protein